MAPHSSSLNEVLRDAEQDLDRCEWPGLIGLVLHPIRDRLLLPSVQLAQAIAPTALPKVVDTAASATVGAACGAVKFAYGVLPHTPSLREISVSEIRQECMQSLARLPDRFGSRDVVVLILSGIGLISNVILDIFTNPGQKFNAFIDTVKVFLAFLIYFGIDEELAQAFLTRGSIVNIAITARIQADLDGSTCIQNRRQQAAYTDNAPLNPETALGVLKESERFMKFSTAAYGTFQIYASGTLQLSQDQSLTPINDAMHTMQRLMGSIVQRLRRRRIAKYLTIRQNQILYLTPPGGDIAVVRHFVAVDHNTKAVILAIRGTYSASDLIADIDGYTTDFCEGLAHKGIAERAINLLENVDTIEAIDKGLEENPGYRLIFTGHSLGAGIAALMNIRVYYTNHPFAQKNLRCIGFACPPVYGPPLSSPPAMQKAMSFQRIKRAIGNTVCFINGEDIIPFMSVDAIRRLADTLNKVDTIIDNMNPIDRFLIARGLKGAPKELVSIVQDGSVMLESLPGAERLKIPAIVVMWMDDATTATKDNDGTVTTDVIMCVPTKLSNLSMLLADNFILDHLPPRYEERFEDLFGKNR